MAVPRSLTPVTNVNPLSCANAGPRDLGHIQLVTGVRKSHQRAIVHFPGRVQSGHVLKKESWVWRQNMSNASRHRRLQNTVGLVAEYVVTGLVMLMTLVSTLRMLGILS